ncbi:hypothetical protein [Mycolicibacterium sp.]|uniref:hypothetical protein n=1 Tax=Mycolicibacterium sp. TaxID=2320850 RepID=UPI0028B0FFC7|nr:hypothetical protein [Mycolicibacterium sp.]
MSSAHDAAGVAAGPVARGSVARVGIATAIAAVCGYGVMYLAARRLEPVGFSVFAVFWGAFGLVTGAANGLLQEATREVRSASLRPASHGPADALGPPPGPRTRPVVVAAGVGLAAATLLAGTSALWAPHVFAQARPLSVALLSAGLAGFCMHATLLGMLAGTGRWSHYGSLMVTDAVTRVLLATAAFVFGWGLAGFLWATVAGSLAWLLLLAVSPAARTAAGLPTRRRVSDFLRGAAHSVAAAGASAILVMGFPVLLKATSGELGARGGVVILAVTLTRAPLLVPMTALQGNLIAYFVDHRNSRLRALLVPAAIIVSVGAVGVVAAYLLGPWILRTAFGPDYVTTGALLAWLTAAAVSIALLTLTGAAAVAAALHRAYSIGWVGATMAAAALLTLPLELETRTVVALLCGPMVGIAVHLAALSRAD